MFIDPLEGLRPARHRPERSEFAGGTPGAERAETYRRTPILAPSPETLRWQVHFLRATVTDEDAFGTYHLFGAGFQPCDLIASEQPDLWEEGYTVAVDLLERAKRLGERWRQAEALHYTAWNLLNGGHPAEALPAGSGIRPSVRGSLRPLPRLRRSAESGGQCAPGPGRPDRGAGML